MKIYQFMITLIILFITFLGIAQSEVLWEKELYTTKFIQQTPNDLSVSESLYEYNDYYFILYFGRDSSTAKKVDGAWVGTKYPVLMKIDNDGNTINQNENVIPMMDSLVNSGVLINQFVRGFKFNENEMLFDIPQVRTEDQTPNIYSFSANDGNLNSIEGTMANNYQFGQYFKSIFADNEIFVLGDGYLEQNQSRLDVHNLFGDEQGETLKYRIKFEMDSFLDSLKESNFANDFLMVDDHTFILSFHGKDRKTIIAKYSYNKEEALKLSAGEEIMADLIWYSIYKPKADQGYNQIQLLDNGNSLVHSGYGSITVLNSSGEVILNKKVFDDTYKNYTITNFMPLKNNTGYYAFWGYCFKNSKSDFAVLITDSDWNVISENHWDFNNYKNVVTDIKEKANGNLIVFGNSLHSDSTANGLYYNYIPYYAELKPNPVSVHEQILDDGFTVSPQPANDYINIALKPSEGFEPSEGSIINIYNTLGEKVMSAEARHAVQLQINISDLPVGMYFVKIGNQTEMFIRGN
ncbi:MAG: T9SS type A sorting domain-containing protein [bacterium]